MTHNSQIPEAAPKEPLAVYVDLQELPTSSKANVSYRDGGPPMYTRNLLFFVLVVVPALLAVVYYGFVASDIFVSETKFVIRSSQRQVPMGLPSASEGISVGGMDVDVAIVNAFIESPDAVAALLAKAGLKEAYGSVRTDPLSRYPGLLYSDSREHLHDYYKSMIDMHYDKTTQITTLKVKAFRPEDTLAISRIVLGEAEALVNQLSERIKTDLIAKSEGDLKEAEVALVAVQNKIASWRSRNNVIDPVGYSKVVGEVIVKLSLQLATLQSRLEQMKSGAPNNPAVRQTALSVSALEKQIEEEWDKLSGKSTSVSTAVGEYEQLMVEYQVAQKVFAIAKASVAESLSKVQRSETYIVAVSLPQLPTIPTYPSRIFSTLLITAIGFMFFLIIQKIWSNISRHGAVVRYTSFKRSG